MLISLTPNCHLHDLNAISVNLKSLLFVYKNSFLVNIHEIKEIRRGKVAKDFERMQEDARKVDSILCFSIFYGTEFNLKVLSVAGMFKSRFIRVFD